MRTTVLCLAMVLVFASVSSLSAATYEVRPDGMGDFPTIQAAIDAAQDGDVIELKNGIFRGEGNRDVNFLGKAITVRSKSQNAVACIIDAEGTPEEPHRGFLFNSGEGPESILEHVTITGGYSPIALTVPAGGAINVTGMPDPLYWTSPTIRHCRFIDNESPYATGAVNFFLSNETITDCYFSGNFADYAIGALAFSGYSNVTVERCVFEDNTTNSLVGALGGGFFDGDVTVATVNDCVFRGNRSGYRDGAVGVSYDVTLIMNRCLFEANEAPDLGGTGGADDRANIQFNECTFVGNSSGRGGVIGLLEEAAAELNSCTMYGNTAVDGSGFHLEDATAIAVNNTIVSFGHGGSAYYGPDSATFSCTDIFGNEGGDWTGVIADQLGVNGNIALDPLFIDPAYNRFTLHKKSPCAPFSWPNAECDLIGAWPAQGGFDGFMVEQDPSIGESEGGGAPDGDGGATEQEGLNMSARSLGNRTEIRFVLASPGSVRLSVYDASGRMVRRLLQGEERAGQHRVVWDRRDESGRAVTSGVYFYRLDLGGAPVGSQKIVLVR